MKVIGTAGHVDHGKSSLVLALTGTDPDRLSEEKRRGMTIDLGFAQVVLPSGMPLSLVDVPGHERFIKNMLAGASGIDASLLVVAADESVMPQTREHVAILQLLGVSTGVVALTKSDLVDTELLEYVTLEVEELLQSTGLAGSAIIPVSSLTGEGLPELVAELERISMRDVVMESEGTITYLPIDRVFTVEGFGTVVTGTLHGGVLGVGVDIELVPGRLTGRVRGMQVHGREVLSAEPGSRVAVNVSGMERKEITRGDMLALPSTVRAVRRFDAALDVLTSASGPVRHGDHVAVYVGSAERSATLTILGSSTIAAGESGWVQVRLVEPVPAVRGQHFVVRLPALWGTVAGGRVIDLSPHHRRHDRGAVNRLRAMRAGRVDDVMRAYLPDDRPRGVAGLAGRAGLSTDTARQSLEAMVRRGEACLVGNEYVSRVGMELAERQIQETLAHFHSVHPLRTGMPREELHRSVGWGQTAWSWLIEDVAKRGILQLQGATVGLVGRTGGVGSRREDADRVLQQLLQSPYSPPDGDALKAAAQTDDAVLSALAESGEIVRIATGLYFARAPHEEMSTAALDTIRRDGSVSVAGFRDQFGTSRKYALAFLEHLDGLHLTRRQGDVRVLGSKAPR